MKKMMNVRCCWALLLFLVLTPFSLSAQSKDDLILGNQYDFKLCGGIPGGQTLHVYNNSVHKGFANGTFYVEWGDGSPKEEWGNEKEKTHLYTEWGTFNLIFSWEPFDSQLAVLQRDYTVIRLPQPTAALVVENDGVCKGAKSKIEILRYAEQDESTEYTLNMGDGTLTLSQKDVEDSLGIVNHVFDLDECPIVITLSTTNACKDFMLPVVSTAQMALFIKPKAEFEIPDVNCSGHPLLIENKTKGGKDLKCEDNSYYMWQFEGQPVAFFEKEPTVVYDKPGEYEVMLIANTGQAECAADTVRGTITVVATPRIDFSVDRDTICSGNVVQFSNLSEGEETLQDGSKAFTYVWSVWDGNGAIPTEKYQYVEGGKNIPDSKIQFDGYGTYHVTLRADNVQCQCVCDDDCDAERKKDTTIVIRKSPEVQELNLSDTICPDGDGFKILDFNQDNLVLYEWNGNKEEHVTWTIETKEGEGSVEYVDGTDENAIYPKVKLKEGATYSFHVEIAPVSVNGIACSEPSKQDKEVTIPNTTIQAKFSPNPSDGPIKVCSGERVEIVNESEGEGITYSWKYDVKGDHKGSTLEVPLLDKKEFSARFNHGVYIITGTMEVFGKCPIKIDGKDKVEYEVQIGKRPEIGEIEDFTLCAGESIKFSKDLIKYNFYDSENKVTWTFNPELPTGAYKEGSSSSPYPKIEFTKPNQIYIYTIEMPEDWVQGCEEAGKKYKHEGTITIHNDKLDRIIQEEGGASVSKSVCIGEKLILENVESNGTQADPSASIVTYEWQVIDTQNQQTSDCQIDDPISNKVEVTFSKPGKYGIVSEVTDDQCAAKDSDTAWIVVKGIPEILFASNPRECEPGNIAMEGWVEIKWFGDDDPKPIVKLEVAGQKFETTENLPEVQLNVQGNYTVNISILNSSCGGEISNSAVIHVIDTAIKNTESIQPARKEFCVGEKLTFTNEAYAERELEWAWEVENVVSGYAFDEEGALTSSEKTPAIVFSNPGDYIVHLTINEGFNKRELRFELKVYGIPELNFSDVIKKCETELLGGNEIKSQVILNGNELLSAQWNVLPQGNGTYRYERGDEHTDFPTFGFKPEKNAGYDSFVLSVEYTTHCLAPSLGELQVHVDELVTIKPFADEHICIWSGKQVLSAIPDTGVWSVAGYSEKILYEKDEVFYFDPVFSTNENREVILRYAIENGQCTSEEVKHIYVHALPFVDAGKDLQMCLNNEPLELVGRDSIGQEYWNVNRGEWRWNDSRLDNNLFDIQKLSSPQTSTPYELVYSYTHLVHENLKCSNTDTVRLFLRELPKTHFEISTPTVSGDTLCVKKGVRFTPKDSLGNVFEWHFDWLEEPDSKKISDGESILYNYDNPGRYGVKCMVSRLYTNLISNLVCHDTSDIKTVTVLRNPPVAYFEIDQTANCAPLNIEISVDKDKYALDYADFTYVWDFGKGSKVTTQELQEKIPQTYQSAIRDTTYTISWKISNRCHSEEYKKSIAVYSVPRVGLTLKKMFYCAPVEVEVNNTTTGDSCKFTWTISNNRNLDTIRDLPSNRDLKYFFDEVPASTIYRIHLHAENRCAGTDTAINLLIKPRTLKADFTILNGETICEGEKVDFRNNSIDTASFITLTKWTFGDGSISEESNPEHIYTDAGIFPIVLYIENGCSWASDTQQVNISPLPKLSIISQDTLCEDEEFHFSFDKDVDLSLFEWKFLDTLIKQESFDYKFDGNGSFPITLVGTTFTRCQDSVIKTVVVNNKPIMTILPLDTAVCSPLDYVPFVEGEYETLLWDYGDGTDVTSVSEHLYENRGDSAVRYSVTAFVTTDKGCYSEFVRGVTVYNTPVAELEKEVESGRPQRVTFLNLSEGADAVRWILPLSGEIYSEKLEDSQTESFMENGVYPVTLIASNRYGCADTITLEHEVDMHGLYFPNTFIPHSLNDKINRFNGIGMGLRSYHLEILDQYGNVLWMTEELDDGKPVGGWDGTNRKGQRMPQGIYIWRAKAIFGNDDIWTGDNNDSGIPEYTQGTVLLLRE